MCEHATQLREQTRALLSSPCNPLTSRRLPQIHARAHVRRRVSWTINDLLPLMNTQQNVSSGASSGIGGPESSAGVSGPMHGCAPSPNQTNKRKRNLHVMTQGDGSNIRSSGLGTAAATGGSSDGKLESPIDTDFAPVNFSAMFPDEYAMDPMELCKFLHDGNRTQYDATSGGLQKQALPQDPQPQSQFLAGSSGGGLLSQAGGFFGDLFRRASQTFTTGAQGFAHTRTDQCMTTHSARAHEAIERGVETDMST